MFTSDGGTDLLFSDETKSLEPLETVHAAYDAHLGKDYMQASEALLCNGGVSACYTISKLHVLLASLTFASLTLV